MPINLVSLGMSCQTSHQIDFFVTQNPQIASLVKSPFDWLICPPDSAAAWLDAGLCDFSPDEIVERLEHAYWPRFELWFWHGFIDRSAESKVLNLQGLAMNELSKLSYLRQKFRALSLSQTLFLISNTQNNLNTEVFGADERARYEFTELNIDKLQQALDHFFAGQVKLHVVTRADRAESSLLGRANVTVLPEDNSNWKGSRPAWGRLLDQLRH